MLLPEEEFDSGLIALERDLASEDSVVVAHYHTLILAAAYG
jgi:hypothetical protein